VNLSIVYQPNETGKKLHGVLKDSWENTKQYQVIINEENHWVTDLPDHQSKFHRMINTPQSIRLCQDADSIYRIMNANNIYCGLQGDETVNRTYSVLICDHEILAIKVNTILKAGEKERYIKEIDNTKVAEIARRAVSLLGLDLGQVNIDFTARRRFKVVAIDPSPELREKDFNKIVERIKKLSGIDWSMAGVDIKLGADPEFMLANTKNGKMVSASQFFPRDGQIGCDNIRVPNRQQRPVAEVRPTPAYCPMELTSNIKKCLDQASRIAPYRNVKWVAGSQPFSGFSIGGHIHFSNIKLDAALLRALDNYLGVTSFLIENPHTAVRRRRKYGHLGDYRLKNHGGFEYRTPGSWLVSREIAAAMLCLAKIIGSRYYQMTKNYLNNPQAQEAFYTGNQEYFRELFPEIWSDIQAIDLYDDYAEALQVIPRMVTSEANWEESQDIRKNWKVITAKRDYTSEVSASSNNPAPVENRANNVSNQAHSGNASQRRVIRSTETSNISYRTPAVRTDRVGSNTGRGNTSLSQGRLNVSSTRRTHITR